MNRLIISIIIFISILFLFSVSFFVYQFNRPASGIEKTQSFEIKPGEGFRRIAKDLEEAGLISSDKYFDFYVLYKGLAGELKPGIYKISPNETIEEIAKKIYRGPVLKEVSVTIPEGFNIYQIDSLLAEKGIIKKNSLVNFRPSSALINQFSFLAQKPREANLEGFLFPDTYRFSVTVGKDVVPVVEKFLKNFDRNLNASLRQTIEREGSTLYRTLILASFIEKEVPEEDDRALVADILERRLKKKMPLQVDASIVYAKMISENVSWEKALPLTGKDYKINSLYNTYLYKGLTPTPICNPGMGSIKAVIYPQKNDYWYYLSDPKGGKTYFSKTLLEHNRKRERYLRR